MGYLVESLGRLYRQGRVTKEKIIQMQEAGIITREEAGRILGEQEEMHADKGTDRNRI